MTDDLRARVRRIQEAAATLVDVADRLMADIDAMTDEPLPFSSSLPTTGGYTSREDWVDGRADDRRGRGRG